MKEFFHKSWVLIKNFFSAVWRLIRSNLLLKILAILFAIVLWSYVLSDTNPTRERVVNDVSISYENTESLEENGLAISRSLSDLLATVDVRVTVNQNQVRSLSKENIEAYIDLSTINGVGVHPLEIHATSAYGEVEVLQSEITLTVDHLVTRPVPVNIEVSGSVPAGYYASDPEITPSIIDISGAKVDVEKVASALCSIDLNGLTESYRKSVAVSLLDSTGSIVDENLFSDTLPSVIVDLNILSMKTVSVDVENSILGQDSIAAGYEITEITSTPNSVNIIGEESVLNGISSVPLVAYSVSGANEYIVIPLEYDLPEGVSVLNSEKAQVYINIRELTDVKEFGNLDLRQKNISSELKADISEDTVDATVIAGMSKLSTLDKSDIVPYVDLEGLEPGVYNLEVQFEIPEGFIKENFTSTPLMVTVTISKK